jgi:hypothetical protein
MQLLDELLPSKLEVSMKDICKKDILLIVLLISLAATAEASVSLQMNFYNSDDSMSMSLEGYNLEFESFCELAPDSLLYNNGGTSKKDDAEYSYSLSLNGESLYSAARTDSGKFDFHGNIDAGSSQGDLFRVSARGAVKDGGINLAYGNNELKVREVVDTENSGYQQEVQIKPGYVSSQGSGSTLQPVPGLMEKLTASGDSSGSTQTTQAIQGIRHSLELEYAEKTGSIYTDVMGSTEAQWATKVSCDSNNYFFGVKVRGISMEPLNDLDMTGKASNFPTQILPPGRVNISYNSDFMLPDFKSPENYAAVVDDEFSEFDAQYPGISTPSLWYSLNNLYYNKVPMTYTPISDPSVGLEIYNFGMGFAVNEN